MTSPALLTPESRDAFANFLHLLAETHPVRACKDGASDVADSLDVDWPVDGLVDLGETRATLASKHICGEAHAARPNAEEWRACAGSTPGKRGYTCGLWLLFHSSAARSSATARDAGRRGSPPSWVGSSTSSVRRLPLAFFGHGEGGWRFRAHQTGRRALRVART